MARDISQFLPDVLKVQRETGIPASIILGQMVLESGKSGGGWSGLAVNGKNLFGIKGNPKTMSSDQLIWMPTTEVVNGKSIVVNAAFRKYDSYYDSIMDHAKLLGKERYAKHLSDAKTVEDFAKGIKAGGYATDPNYVSKLLGVIESNGYHKYDNATISFNPGATHMNNDAGTGGAGGGGSYTSPNAGSTDTSNLSTIEKGFFGTIRILLILLLGIFAIVFIMKAFPQTSTALDAANPLNKAKLAKNVVKMAGKVGSK